MKNWLLSICFLFVSFSGMAQMDYEEEDLILIDPIEITPSLSFLAPEIPSTNFTLREVNFLEQEVKKGVNMVAVMEQEKNRKPRTVEISSPFTRNTEKEKGVFKISDDVRFHNRGSNYDFYTGKTRNAAYREMRAGLFRGVYSPYVGGRYHTPYYYSPFLR